jgi:4-deoxy-L-threo-5-hexosulose-uronate ketol-isomerase
MQIRNAISPKESASLNSQELRDNFLIEKVCAPGEINLVYSHYDRVIIGGASPLDSPLTLPTFGILRSNYFLERRELGAINVGGAGRIKVGDEVYDLPYMSCLYVGKGNESVVFESVDAQNPAHFYLLSSPAHQPYPTRRLLKEEASPVEMGAPETANKRTIYKYIYLESIRSCQLVMGLTVLAPGSVWNTMPPHVHDRRMEAYFYFNVADNHRVLHLMGEPQETRHMWVANHQAIISPPWSIHAGSGTASYSFIWGMAGENQEYTDMDPQPVEVLR